MTFSFSHHVQQICASCTRRQVRVEVIDSYVSQYASNGDNVINRE